MQYCLASKLESKKADMDVDILLPPVFRTYVRELILKIKLNPPNY